MRNRDVTSPVLQTSLNGDARPVGDDLAWLATRYVLGELSTDELQAFECRLEHDLAACEAVAAATGLVDQIATTLEAVEASVSVGSGLVHLADCAVVVRPSLPCAAGWSKTRALYGWGTLAAVVLCLGFVGLTGSNLTPEANSFARRPQRMQETRRLIGLWRTASESVSVVEGMSLRDDADPRDVPAATIVNLSLHDEVMDDPAEETGAQVPDWLLAAVSLDEERVLQNSPTPAPEGSSTWEKN